MKSETFRREELIVIYLSGIVLRPRKNHEMSIHEMIIGLLKNQFRQDNEGDDQSQANLKLCANY